MVRFTKDLVRTWTSALDDTMGGRSAQPRASARGRYTTTRSSQPAQKPSSASFSSNHAQATDGSGRRKPYERHRSCHVGPAAPDQVVPCPRHSRGRREKPATGNRPWVRLPLAERCGIPLPPPCRIFRADLYTSFWVHGFHNPLESHTYRHRMNTSSVWRGIE